MNEAFVIGIHVIVVLRDYCLVLGRIKAIQLEYSEAHRNLVQAIRKAPQYSAVGFKQTVSASAFPLQMVGGS